MEHYKTGNIFNFWELVRDAFKGMARDFPSVRRTVETWLFKEADIAAEEEMSSGTPDEVDSFRERLQIFR